MDKNRIQILKQVTEHPIISAAIALIIGTFLLDHISPIWKSKSTEASITIGDSNKGIQTGDYSIQNNHLGITDIELAKQLGVTETAIQNFFEILEQQQVPHEGLDHTLRKLAERHKELERRVALLESEDPEVFALQQQARNAIADAQYEKAEDLLDQAVELDNAAAEKANEFYLKRKRSAAENMALKAESLLARFALTDAIKAYEKTIGFAQEAKADEMTVEYQNMLGVVYFENGQSKDAVIYFEKVLASDLKTYGEDHPSVAIRHNNLGMA